VALIKTAATAFVATKYVVEIQVILIIVAMIIKSAATVIVVLPDKSVARMGRVSTSHVNLKQIRTYALAKPYCAQGVVSFVRIIIK
jgi:hypothetical protein